MDFAIGLPWIPIRAENVPLKIEGISGSVEIAKTISTEEEKVKPGVIPQGGSVMDGLKSIAKGFEKVMVDPLTLAGIAKGGMDLFSGVTQTAPTTATSQADGKSGDISGGVHYGDIIAKGFKFDLGTVPSWFWILAAVGSAAGFILLNKKRKK